MKTSCKSLVICFLVILFAVFSGNGWAASSNTPINGTVTVSGDGSEVMLSIPPNNPYHIAELRVSPPFGGEVLIQEFYRSEKPSFIPLSGDGYYNFELTLHPVLSQELQDKIKAATENHAQKRQGGLPVTKTHSGGFRIQDGQLVLDNTEE